MERAMAEGQVQRERRHRMFQTQVWLTRELRSALHMVENEAEASMGDVVRSALIYFMEREYPHCLIASGIVPRSGRSKQRVMSRATTPG
jgi:hypothetical protein